ncbi:MAG: HEAT repeat domain-containing protein [Chloroflexi bacterium]|nr:HEAT repeat domain-containing protein [Chloroflexota bacterium]
MDVELRQRFRFWAARLGLWQRRFVGDPVSTLADPSPRRRWEMAAALATAPVDRDEIMTLVGALADKEPFVRWQAGQSLAALGSRASLESLLQALRTPPVVRQAAAAEALGTLGDQRAVPALLEAARSQNVGLRASAVEALGHIGTADAAPLFLQMLRDEAAGVRRAAAWALGKLGDSSAADALVVRLNDEQEHVLVRRSAAWALGRMPLNAAAVAELTKALDDPDPQVRWYAAKGLGRGGDAPLDETTEAALRAHLNDEERALHGPVSEAAQKALRRLRLREWWRRLTPRRSGREKQA